MAELTAAKISETTKALTPFMGMSLLKGRCMNVRRFDNRFFHLVALPAADEYSMPQIVEVESNSRRFDNGQDCMVLVRVGGYPNNFTGKDAEGNKQDVKSARVTLVGLFAD